MKDKIIKEDENFVWRETESGIGYVYSKNCCLGVKLQPLDEERPREMKVKPKNPNLWS